MFGMKLVESPSARERLMSFLREDDHGVPDDSVSDAEFLSYVAYCYELEDVKSLEDAVMRLS